MVRQLIEDCIGEKDIGSYIENLWDRIGGKLRAKGVNRKDIRRAIKDSREGG